MFRNVSGFRLQKFRGFPVQILVGTFVLLRIPQQANIVICSGFCNCKLIPQTAPDFANTVADSASSPQFEAILSSTVFS